MIVECRSQDCDERAEFFAWLDDTRLPSIQFIEARQVSMRLETGMYIDSMWTGFFCTKHLQRVVVPKMAELRWHDRLIFERIA